MTKKWQHNIHPQFQLNGRSYDNSSLPVSADEFIREGSDFEKQIGLFLKAWCSDDPYITARTSGSTGEPKRVQLKKEHMVNSAQATAAYLGVHENTRALLCLSTDTIAGKMMLVRAMVLGWHLDTIQPSSSPLKNSMGFYDFCAMVPLQLRNSLTQLRKIGKVIVGGAPLPIDLKREISAATTEIYESFGMTETVSHIALKKSNHIEGKEEDFFQTLPGVQIEADERGCLVIEAPQISDTKVVTNDLVEIHSPQHFSWLGRWDNVINSGGVKLIPELIEKKLAPHFSERFILTSIPDKVLTNKLVMVVESNLDTRAFSDRISEAVELDRFELPKHIFSFDEFPETRSGKPDRVEIRRLLQNRVTDS